MEIFFLNEHSGSLELNKHQEIKQNIKQEALFASAPLAFNAKPILNFNPYSVCMKNPFVAGPLFSLEFTNVKHIPKIIIISCEYKSFLLR